MSKVQTLSNTFTKPDESDDIYDGRFVEPWVKLTQKIPKKNKLLPSISDIYSMMTLSSYGYSSFLHRPVGFPVQIGPSLVTITIGFSSWPSHPDLPYDMTVSLGTISRGAQVPHEEDFSVFFDGTDIEYPFYMNNVSTRWESPTYDGKGDSIIPPRLTNLGNFLVADYYVFGGLRVRGGAIGSKNSVSITIDKGTATSAIRGVSCTVTATWFDLEGNLQSTSLLLEVPEEVKNFLEHCPLTYFENICVRPKPPPPPVTVYYNGCTGEIMGTKPGEKDNSSYCDKGDSNDWL